MSVRYRAFGEMAVTVGGVRHALTRPRERAVLSVLLSTHGAPVAAERLVREVWGDEAPSRTLASLQVVVSRLRSLLEPDRAARTATRLVSTAAGYALRAETDDVDTWGFEAATHEALAAEAPADRLAGCDASLGLWSGPPYPDADPPLARAEADRLVELRLTVVEHRARALIDLGRPEEAQRSLAEAAPEQPFRERMWALLALARYQCSRQAEALATLRELRERLADELGVDPSEEVRDLEAAVLRQDPSLRTTRPAARVPAPPPRGPVPEDVGGPLPRDTSVGREAVLDRLLAVHGGAVDDSRARFVLVAGEAGIGKSRLVEDLRRAVAGSGTTCVVGLCLEGDYAPALWPWLAVVRPLAERHRAAGALEPMLRGEPPDAAPGAGTTLRMFDAVRDLLATAAAEAPVLVVLEDVHWADASSLLLLRHLAASPPEGPVTVVCTRRTADARLDEVLVDTMAALARAGAERVRLDGVDEAAVRLLLERTAGTHDARLDAFVAEVSAGNPFFVLQYARLLGTLPDLADVDPGGLPVPDGVRDVLRQRVSRLPEAAARLLVAASVLGRHVDPEVLAELTRMPLDDCLDQLDLALASGLLEEERSAYAFVHALARETLHDELSAARRMRLHDRVSRILESRTGDDADAAAEIAHHAHVAAPLGPEQAARACTWLARAAAVAAARHAHPEALALWEQVLADTDAGSRDAATAQRGRAAALIRMGRTAEGHDALDSAVAISSRHGDWAMVAAEATTVLIGAGPWSWREHGVVHEPFVEVLTAALPHVEPAVQARLLAILQMEHFYGWRSRIVEEYGRRSVALARESGDRDLLRDTLMLRINASTGSWGAAERLAWVEELLALRPEGELGVTALFNLGQVRWDCGDPDGADEAMERCGRAAAEVRHTRLDIPLAWWRAARARDRAAPDHGDLVDAALEAHRAVGYVASRELECLYAIRRGGMGSPVDDATVRLAAEGGMPLRALVAHALLEAGDATGAAELLGEPAPDEVVDYASTAGRCLRLLVLSSTGTAQEVREALGPVEAHLGTPISYGTIDHLGVVDHFVAAGYAALGDPRAVDVARSAVAVNARLGCEPWRWRSANLLASLGG